MSVVNKVMDWFGVNSNDEEYDDVELNEADEVYDEDEDYNRSSFKPRNVDNIERDSRYSRSSANSQVRLVSTNGGATASKMVITQPTCYDEVETIGEYLKGQKSVIINLENVSKEDARRILDFMSGATFMVEGTIQKVSSLIYLFTPKNVEIQNDVEQSQYKQQKMSFSWLK